MLATFMKSTSNIFLNSDLYESNKKFLCTMCLCIMVKYTESGVGGLCTIKINPGIPVARFSYQ